MVLGAKNWVVIGRGQKIGNFCFSWDWWLCATGKAIGIHTGTGRQCADAIETGVGADRPACMHMGMGLGSGGRRRAKGGDGAAYIMPSWAGKTAS